MIKQFFVIASEVIIYLTNNHLWGYRALRDFIISTQILRTKATENDILMKSPVFDYPETKLFIIISFAVIVSVLIGFFILKDKLKKQKILANYETETKIAKKVHDEIANEIYNVLSFASSQDLAITKNRERLLNNLETVYNKSRNISREINSIDTGYGYKSQLKLMLSEYHGANVNIIIKDIDNIKWHKINKTKKIAVYRALQEIMVNMKKHSNATIVVIKFKLKRGKICISYSDNGTGIQTQHNTAKNGLLNVENRMVSIKGKVIFEPKPGKGLHLTLTYPA